MTPKVVFASAAMAMSLAIAAPASGAAFVLGGGLADACSRFAVQGRSDDYSLSTCTYALETESLVKRDRAATLVNRGVIQLRRKAFAAARFAEPLLVPWLGAVDAKTLFVIAQVVGYATSKFLGIKIVSPLVPGSEFRAGRKWRAIDRPGQRRTIRVGKIRLRRGYDGR